MDKINIIENIRNKYLGIQFKHGGRDVSGLDCWGLVISVFAELNINIYDMTYTPNWSYQNNNYFIEKYYSDWTKLKDNKNLKFLDVLLINNNRGIPFHAGVYLEKNRFIHAGKAGVVISKIQDKIWLDRLAGVYRHVKVN